MRFANPLNGRMNFKMILNQPMFSISECHEPVAKALAKDVDSISKSQDMLSTKVNDSIESLNEKVDDIKVNLLLELKQLTNRTRVAVAVSTIIIPLLVFLFK